MKFFIPWQIAVNVTILAIKSGFLLSINVALLDGNVIKMYFVIIKAIYHKFNTFIKHNILYFF